ncbi:hypothetical protein KY339_02465 [Candidatus Woesearchaeota archaeon]|nr:hypothetical protein [Candidatus Woesearchaeota archaeon]
MNSRTLNILLTIGFGLFGIGAGESSPETISKCGSKFSLKYDLQRRLVTAQTDSGFPREKEKAECFRSVPIKALDELLHEEPHSTKAIDFSKFYSSKLLRELWDSEGIHAIDLNGDKEADLVMRVDKASKDYFRVFYEYIDGKLVRELRLLHLDKKPYSETTYEYDSEDRVSKEVRGTKFLQSYRTIVYKYYEDGEMKLRATYRGKSTKPSDLSSVIEWDEKGRKTKKLFYDKNGNLELGTFITFDEKDRKIKEMKYFRGRRTCSFRGFKVDSKGNKKEWGYEDEKCDLSPEMCYGDSGTHMEKCGEGDFKAEMEYLKSFLNADKLNLTTKSSK